MKRGDSADYALEISQVDHLIRSCATLEELVKCTYSIKAMATFPT